MVPLLLCKYASTFSCCGPPQAVFLGRCAGLKIGNSVFLHCSGRVPLRPVSTQANVLFLLSPILLRPSSIQANSTWAKFYLGQLVLGARRVGPWGGGRAEGVGQQKRWGAERWRPDEWEEPKFRRKFRLFLLSLGSSRGIVVLVQGHGPLKVCIWASGVILCESRRPAGCRGFSLPAARRVLEMIVQVYARQYLSLLCAPASDRTVALFGSGRL